MHMRHMHMYIIIMLLLSFFMDAFCLSSKFCVVVLTIGIVAVKLNFVKNFFEILSFLPKLLLIYAARLCFFGKFISPYSAPPMMSTAPSACIADSVSCKTSAERSTENSGSR